MQKKCMKQNEKGDIVPDFYCLANTLVGEEKIITFMESENIYYYDISKEQWIQSGEHLVKQTAEEYWRDKCTRYHVNEAIEAVKRKTYISDDEVSKLPPEFIPLENGLYDLENDVMIPHNSEYFYTFKLPVHYDPQADCPNFKRFLEEVQPNEENRNKLQEFMGYCLYRNNFLDKAIMLVGAGGTGKSVLLHIINELLAKENCANLSLHQIVYNKFATALIYDKHANLHADIPEKQLKDYDTFMKLVCGDRINVEPKYKPGFNATPFCKLIFACNVIPLPDTENEAYFERWEIMEFNQKFRGSEKQRSREELIEEMTTNEELSGILKYALEGLKRLREQGNFTDPMTGEKAKELYKQKSSNLYEFVNKFIVFEPEKYIEKSEFYNRYCEWCREEGKIPVSLGEVTSKLPHYTQVKTSKRDTEEGRRWVYLHIKWIDEDEEPEEPEEKQDTLQENIDGEEFEEEEWGLDDLGITRLKNIDMVEEEAVEKLLSCN